MRFEVMAKRIARVLEKFRHFRKTGSVDVEDMTKGFIKPTAFEAWTSDPGALGVMLIIPISIFFPLGWGIHSIRRNWTTDFQFDKRLRKSPFHAELKPEGTE